MNSRISKNNGKPPNLFIYDLRNILITFLSMRFYTPPLVEKHKKEELDRRPKVHIYVSIVLLQT